MQTHLQGKIIACSGGQGTGKTTKAKQLYEKLKKANPNKKIGLVINVTRNAKLIKLPINQETTIETQTFIFSEMISAHIAAAAQYDIVVTDRTIVDAIAYTALAGRRGAQNMITPSQMFQTAQAMIQIVQPLLFIYKNIHFCLQANNPYLRKDDCRDDDPIFAAEIEMHMLSVYQRLNVELDYDSPL